MASEVLDYQIPVNKLTYQAGTEERWRQARGELLGSHVIRMLRDSEAESYAFECPVYIIKIDDSVMPKKLSVDFVDADGRIMSGVDLDFNDRDFFIADNRGSLRDKGLPEGLIDAGYLVGTDDPIDRGYIKLTETARV